MDCKLRKEMKLEPSMAWWRSEKEEENNLSVIMVQMDSKIHLPRGQSLSFNGPYL